MFVEPDEMNPWVLGELVDEVAKSMFIIFKKPWQLSEVSTEWKQGTLNF